MPQQLIIILFFLMNLLIAGYSFFSDYKGYATGSMRDQGSKGISRSFFKDVKYYSLDNEAPGLDLIAEELFLVDGNKQITFFSPKGISYGANGSELNFSGELGRYTEVDKKLILSESAHLFTSNADLKCKNATYLANEDLATCKGEVRSKSTSSRTGDKLNVEADFLKSNMKTQYTVYEGNVKGEVRRKKRYESPIDFEADKAQVDLEKSVINLNDNVKLKQMGVTATSRHGEIYLENYNKKLKYFLLYDDVVVKEKVVVQEANGPREYLRRALSEKLEGITSEEVLILTGYPKVYQMDDVIRGNRIILRRDSELIEVEDANTQFFMNGKDGKKQ